MNRIIITAFLCLVMTAGNLLAQSEQTFRNPVIPADFSDPDVIRVGDDYYGIASTFCFSPGMIIYHSKDLVNWEIINHVVDDITFLNPEMDWTQMKGYYNGIWAGSLRYHEGIFYCHFCTPKGGWFVATTKDIRGNWEIQAMRDANGKELRGRGWDDPCPLWDEDGQAYIVASNFGEHWWPHIFKMSPDGTQLLDAVIDPKSDLSKNMELIGGYVVKPFRTAEAAKLYKWNDQYYIYFSEVRKIHGNNVRVPIMRRSKSIYGPYEEEILLHSQGKQVDKEPNQGAIVDTPDGKDWYFVTHHGTGDFEGRAISVLPVTWRDGWPHVGIDSDADGVGEMVWELPSPIPAAPKLKMQTSDEFTSAQLSHLWEFNHQPRTGKWSLTEREGHLRLHAFAQLRQGDFFTTGNVLSQRYQRWEQGRATAKIDLRSMSEGQQAGIAHFNGGKDYATFGVQQTAEGKELVFSTKAAGKDAVTITVGKLASNCKTIYLRTEMDYSGQAHFFWSANNRNYKQIDGSFQLKWGSYRGDRIGVYTFNNSSESGYIDVDSFEYIEVEK